MSSKIAPDTAIRLRGVTKSFGAAHPVLNAIDLDIARGEICGVIGRSGAGKSTLVRLLNGLEQPDGGTIVIDGENIETLDSAGRRQLHQRVQMIFQHFGLLSSRTVAQNVALPLLIAGAAPTHITARVADLLKRVGLTDHADKYPAQLSGGQKQRVGIARALATNPDILLCDEATSALDPETTAQILALLAELNRDLGLTIVIITHEMDVVRRICDRVVVLEHGQIAAQGQVADILAAYDGASHADLDMVIADFDGLVVHFTVQGRATLHPILSEMTQANGTAITLLACRVDMLRDGPFGQFTLGLSGEGRDATVAALESYGKVRRHGV